MHISRSGNSTTRPRIIVPPLHTSLHFNGDIVRTHVLLRTILNTNFRLKNEQDETKRTNKRSNSNRLALRFVITLPTWPERWSKSRREGISRRTDLWSKRRRKYRSCNWWWQKSPSKKNQERSVSICSRRWTFVKDFLRCSRSDPIRSDRWLLTDNDSYDKNSEQMNADEKSIAKTDRSMHGDQRNEDNLFTYRLFVKFFNHLTWKKRKKRKQTEQKGSWPKKNERSHLAFNERSKEKCIDLLPIRLRRWKIADGGQS